MGQQWEYCELGTDYARCVDTKKKIWHHNAWIRYYSSNGESLIEDLAREAPREAPFNPWRKALGLLGGAGWELVSIQHGNAFGGTLAHGFPDDEQNWRRALLSHDKVAYFKRPVVSGRPVNEPRVML